MVESYKRLQGKGAVVTGGAGGIGAATCRALVKEGAKVAVVDVAADAVDAVVAELEQIRPGAAIAAVCDVRDPQSIGEGLRSASVHLPSVDVVVALAGGSFGVPTASADVSSADFDLVADVNVKGTFLTIQALLPFLESGSSIVTVASLAAHQPTAMAGAAYAAAKAGILGLTRSIAAELGPRGVRVNAVAPGLMLTDRLRALFDTRPESDRSALLDAIPLRRLPSLQELIDPILFLASSQSSYITGTTLDVNGGRYMA